jgi:molecular chaperone DnaJ
MIERVCQTCGGTGTIVSNPCRKCSGSGRLKGEKNLEVNIPSGVDNGSKIKISGEGEAGFKGAPCGDLYVFVSIKPHKLFTRKDKDICCKVPVSMVTAALGGEVKVLSIDGAENIIKIPHGTQSGHQFRLKSKGMPGIRSFRKGDMIVDILVEVPVSISRKQKELLLKFAEEGSEETNSPQTFEFRRRTDSNTL